MNCPICGEATNTTLTYEAFLLVEEHNKCKHEHWWRDWFQKNSIESERCGFFIDKNLFINQKSDIEYTLCVVYFDGHHGEVCGLSLDEVDTYLYIAKSLWNKSIEDKGE